MHDELLRFEVEVMSGSEKWSYEDAATWIAKTYNDLRVPLIFLPWAHVLADEVGLSEGDSVLDVATGPGTVAGVAAARVGATGKVVGVDISPAMLSVARGKAPASGAAPIDYVEAPAERLSVPSASFHVALCQQGLQFFGDRLAALREMQRALMPGGRLGLAVWASTEQGNVWEALGAAFRQIGRPELAERTAVPFRSQDPRELAQLLAEAGFQRVRIRSHTLPLVFKGGCAQLIDATMGTPMGPQISAMPQSERRILHDALAEQCRAMLRSGCIHSQMTANIATAIASDAEYRDAPIRTPGY